MKMEEQPKKLIEKAVTAYEYSCPYCGHNFGVIEDAGYKFERTWGCDCPDCGKTFSVDGID